MKIVIPMAGFGERFHKAGYREIKPLIKIGGKPMIQHVVEAFPGEEEFIFICNNGHLKSTNLESVLKGLKPRSVIVGIDPHRGGAVDTFLAAQQFIPDDEEIIFNYCDFTMDWDYNGFLSSARSADASLPCFTGFHPASLGNVYYCYVRVDDKKNALELREKMSFTGSKMKEFASTGTFYFRKGSLAKKYAKRLVDSGIVAENGERYFSLMFNIMIGDGLGVNVYEVKKFVCFGTPRDVQQYEFWRGVFRDHGQLHKKVHDWTTLIPAAGRGKRFSDAGYELPKPIIPVDGQPMIAKAVKDLPQSEKTIFVCLEDQLKNGLESVLKKEFPGCDIVSLKETTPGMVNTCLLAKDLWNPGKPLLISACDYGLHYDIDKFESLANDPSIDAIIWTFKNHECVLRNPKAYAYVAVDGNGNAAGISEKAAISDNPGSDHAVVSVFWYRTAGLFEKGARSLLEKGKTVGGEYYVATSINGLIEEGHRVVPFEVEKFVCWGTPDDLKEYEYWKGYFSKLSPA
ncbi:MAG: NTP transferase domain-containing protein [Candidatus Aenigmarchaeota archaeon]|nr:NTP transferase domain-containing protein [Candidatus Aenigmarchaeota archaeon]